MYKHVIISGVARSWQGAASKNYLFFRLGNMHVAKRHAAHGEAMCLVRGVRGYAPENFFKMVQFGAFLVYI